MQKKKNYYEYVTKPEIQKAFNFPDILCVSRSE